MGLRLDVVCWTRARVRVALRGVGPRGFLFHGVLRSWVRVHFGFCKVSGKDCVRLVGV